MRRCLFIVIITMMSCGIVTKTVRNDEKYYFVYLNMLIHSQYYYDYTYPKDFEEFISFVNKEDFPEDFDYAIQKLNANKNKLEIKYKTRPSDSVLCCYLYLKKEVIYETPVRSICGELDGEDQIPSFYFRNRFFDKQLQSINNDDIEQKFKQQIKEVKLQYRNAEKYSDTKRLKYVSLKYSMEGGLSFFCEESKQEFQDYNYIHDLEVFLESFCVDNEINQIILVTPILIDKDVK